MRKTPLKRKPKKAPTAAEKRYWDSLPTTCAVAIASGFVTCLSFEDVVIHHILADAPNKRMRRDNMLVVKLCPACHNMSDISVHMLGSEAAFERKTGVDLVAIAVRTRDAWERAHPIAAPDRGVP